MEQFTFCNPVPFSDGKRHTNPDPFVLRWCGAYYCYATDEAGIKVSVSEDLVHWQDKGYAIRQQGHQNFWAPAVLYENGIFYLYYSHEPKEILQLATSHDSLGPFVWQMQLSELFSIDAHPVLWHGDRYLFYASDEWMGCEEERPGTSILLDKLCPDGSLEGHPVPVVLLDADEEIFACNRFGDGRDWHTLEGPCLLAGEERSFLMYSANCYESEYYYVHYAVAENKEDLREMVWHKQEKPHAPFPLLHRSEMVEGTGHNTVVQAPDLVHWWIIYHGRPAEEPIIKGIEQRQMYIAPLRTWDDVLWTPAPTTAPQEEPQKPNFYCAQKHLVAQERWEICTVPETAIFEMWFHPQTKHTGVHFSLFLAELNEQNWLELTFSTGRRQITIWENWHGIRRCIAQTELPRGFAMFIPHLLTITGRFGEWSVCLDGKKILKAASRLREGNLSVKANHSEVTFYGLSMTQWFSLTGSELMFLTDWLTVSPAELTEIGLYGHRGILQIEMGNFPHSEETFSFYKPGSCAVLIEGEICARIDWELGSIQLRRICIDDQCRFFANEEQIWSGERNKNMVLLIENTWLHQYSFAGL